VNGGLCEWCDSPLDGYRRDARFCGAECRYRAWAHDHPRQRLQRLVRPRVASRRASRDGRGIKLYLLPDELAAIAEGVLPASVQLKVAGKLARAP
jgi:hypothetical protein